jgi:hypothetical protein
MYRRFPTLNAWRRHTRGAAKRGLSAGALACLGTQPRAITHPDSPTGFYGIVFVLRFDVLPATDLVAAAIGPDFPIPVVTTTCGAEVWAPISKQAARELAHARRIPDIPSPGHGQNTAAYDAIMRPTRRARLKADAICAEA